MTVQAIQNLQIKRGYEGPQLLLQWDSYDNAYLKQLIADMDYQFPITGVIDRLGQKFQVFDSVDINAVAVKLKAGYGTILPDNRMHLSVWTVVAGVPTVKLADATNEAYWLSLLPAITPWANVPEFVFTFSPSVSLTPGTDYAFIMEGLGTITNPAYVGAVSSVDVGADVGVLLYRDGALVWHEDNTKDCYFQILIDYEIKVRRAVLDYPALITDGIEVYSGTGYYFSDLAVDGGQTYYYHAFVVAAGNDYSDDFSKIFETALDGGDYHLRLWHRLAELYRNKDVGTLQKLLEPLVGPLDEQYNWDEDTDAHGQLYRFLKLFGLEFGSIRELIEYFGTFYDVDNVRVNHLPLLAQYVGLRLIPSLSIARQRFLIRNAIFLYQIRGTLQGSIDFATAIVGLVPIVTEFRKNLLRYNVVNSTYIDITAGLAQVPPWKFLNTPTDPYERYMDFTLWAQWTPRTIGFWFNTPYTNITADMLALIEEYFKDFVPMTVFWYIFGKDGAAWRQVYPT